MPHLFDYNGPMQTISAKHIARVEVFPTRRASRFRGSVDWSCIVLDGRLMVFGVRIQSCVPRILIFNCCTSDGFRSVAVKMSALNGLDRMISGKARCKTRKISGQIVCGGVPAGRHAHADEAFEWYLVTNSESKERVVKPCRQTLPVRRLRDTVR